MLFECAVCETNLRDDRPDLPIMEMLRHPGEHQPLGRCPKCGAVMPPSHIQSNQRALWFRAFSRCPNATFCCDADSYRAECEDLVFYPGCLNALLHGVNDLRFALEKVHGIDIAAERMAEMLKTMPNI